LAFGGVDIASRLTAFRYCNAGWHGTWGTGKTQESVLNNV